MRCFWWWWWWVRPIHASVFSCDILGERADPKLEISSVLFTATRSGFVDQFIFCFVVKRVGGSFRKQQHRAVHLPKFPIDAYGVVEPVQNGFFLSLVMFSPLQDAIVIAQIIKDVALFQCDASDTAGVEVAEVVYGK